jgi:hypothetical protein
MMRVLSRLNGQTVGEEAQWEAVRFRRLLPSGPPDVPGCVRSMFPQGRWRRGKSLSCSA